MKQIIACIAVASLLAGCAHPNRNTYGYQDVGQASVVEFGRIVSMRPVDIHGQNTGLGAAAGLSAGAVGGSMIGNGNGSLAGLVAGALIGGVIGGVAEQSASDHIGIEYVITTRKGVTLTIVQNTGVDDASLRIGQRVMIQTTGTYKRVLPADNLPTKVKRAKAITVTE